MVKHAGKKNSKKDKTRRCLILSDFSDSFATGQKDLVKIFERKSRRDIFKMEQRRLIKYSISLTGSSKYREYYKVNQY